MDRLWKIIERSGGIVGTLCAVITAIYTVGIFYGWDKSMPSKPTSPVMSASWLLYALGAIGLALLATSWIMIFIRARQPKKLFIPRPTMLPLNEVEISFASTWHVSPWLELYLTFFNASGFIVRPQIASGRIKVGGQEFHGHIELNTPVRSVPADGFFRVGLRVPLSAAEAKYIGEMNREGHILVVLPNAKIVFEIASFSRPATLDIPLPNQIHFNARTGRTDPYLPWRI
jgi:hypothetical protein